MLLVTIVLPTLLLSPDQNAPKPSPYLILPRLELEAVSRPGNRFEIRWRGRAQSATVQVRDSYGHPYGKPITFPAGAGHLEIRNTSGLKRPYFNVSFHRGSLNGVRRTVSTRFVEMDGVPNIRDLGGYATRNGKHVRWGLAYRSSQLGQMSDGDLELMSRELHICTIEDFRGPDEVKANPDRPPVRHLGFPISASSARIDPKGTLGDGYVLMVDRFGRTVFGPFLQQFADKRSLPIDFHCTAGKDRTGIGSFLLLCLLGVPEDQAIAEYTLTNERVDLLMAQLSKLPIVEKMMKANPGNWNKMIAADPAWMQKTLAHINSKYGSVRAYIRTACGVSDATVKKIRANLLE